MPRKRRLVLSVSLLLVLGFVATSLGTYLVSGSALREQIVTSGLPLTSDNIYSDIQNDLLPPILVSATMAQDTFLRDWVLGGERDVSKIIKYLTEVRARNNTITAFFVSESTRNYYHPTGIVETVDRGEPSDKWYFRVREMEPDYEINVDQDQANRFSLTVFVNYKVFDYEENLIGATGVGLEATTMLERIDSYEEHYDRDIYFVDPDGLITLQAGSDNGAPGLIQDRAGLADIAADILDTERGKWEYRRGGETILLNTRYIPELDWFLFVEQAASTAISPVRRAFILSLGLGLAIAALVVVLTQLTLNRYQRRLERMATTDNLTGIANRHGFEMLAESYAEDRSGAGLPNSVILMDLDQLKQINDRHGHMTGDTVIREVAELARGLLRSSDVICRWGGEEFVIWLRDCALDDAVKLAERMRERIREHRFAGGTVRVTASLGVVQHQVGETLDSTLRRADRAMYEAKTQGRDRVQTSAS
ncbi:MAG TPA: sensor domain-containing diguanylate cyclase [Arenicellales bacterium]|nr:sensor domain-containing diguanylate cyclase [Arenicellales bacterium]